MKGKFTRDATVWCGLCETWEYVETDSRATIKQAEREAHRMGWIKTQEHGWICPACNSARKG